MERENFGGRRIVHGTPITPNHLLESLAGSSFCVSFAKPDQLDRCIDLVNAATDEDGHDQLLLLDNGAFSIWQAEQKGRQLPERLRFRNQAEYREAYWRWANEAQERCPTAVAVIPDVIMGDEHQNLLELSWALRECMADYPERAMSIWHMDESQDYLATQCRLLNFIGIGSCADFDVQRRRGAYLDKMGDVYTTLQAIKAIHGRRPWVHLMRGLGVFEELAWADSADSCNVAVNSHRLREEYGDLRAVERARRIEQPIQAASARIALAK